MLFSDLLVKNLSPLVKRLEVLEIILTFDNIFENSGEKLELVKFWGQHKKFLELLD